MIALGGEGGRLGRYRKSGLGPKTGDPLGDPGREKEGRNLAVFARGRARLLGLVGLSLTGIHLVLHLSNAPPG